MRFYPKNKEPQKPFKEEKQNMSKQLALIVAFVSTFGFFVKILFF